MKFHRDYTKKPYSSRNVSKYEFLTSKDVLLEKVAAIKNSERTEKEN